MYHPRLYGGFYEMGHKYGALLHKNKVSLPEMTNARADFGAGCYEELRHFYPELIQEVRGFADGMQIKEEVLGAFIAGLAVYDDSAKCSVFAFRNQSSTVVGRNYDMLYEFKKITESSLIAPEGKHAYISQSDLFIGRSDGMNEHGLFVAMSFVNGTMIQPGITFHFVIRKVLDSCSTVEESIKVIREAKVTSANNFLLADKSGNMAVVETAPQATTVRKPEGDENFLYITNEFKTREMKPFDKGGIAWSKTTERNQALYDRLKSADEIDMEQAKSVLADKCVCLDLKKEKFGTIWSVVADLNTLTLERAEGRPTMKNFKPDTRLEWWLNKRTGK